MGYKHHTKFYKGLAKIMEAEAMRKFSFKNYRDSLKHSNLEQPSINSFWQTIKCLLPCCNQSSNSDGVIPHPAIRLFTSSRKNGYLKPQKPHQDYTPTECERETPMPWKMIM